MKYEYTAAGAVIQAFAEAKKADREKLLRIFQQLTANPFQAGDAVQLDDKGRACQVKRFADWTITYWAEHLANEIHIVSIERLRS